MFCEHRYLVMLNKMFFPCDRTQLTNYLQAIWNIKGVYFLLGLSFSSFYMYAKCIILLSVSMYTSRLALFILWLCRSRSANVVEKVGETITRNYEQPKSWLMFSQLRLFHYVMLPNNKQRKVNEKLTPEGAYAKLLMPKLVLFFYFCLPRIS